MGDYAQILNQLHSYKLASTSFASVVAALVTYPAERYRVEWEETTLRYWNPELENVTVRNRFRVLGPIFRLWSNELASTLLNSTITTISFTNNRGFVSDSLQCQIVGGTIAGVSQAFLLAPLGAWRATQVMQQEKVLSSTWGNWVYNQVLRGGSIDPDERRSRALRGVGLTALREVVYNVTFFPLFHTLRKHFSGFHMGHDRIKVANTKDFAYGEESITSMIASGVVAGGVCSLTVTPLDVLRSYMMNSRERWSLWSGKKIYAAPISILARGLILQAFCYGPAFGIVAAIYEYV